MRQGVRATSVVDDSIRWLSETGGRFAGWWTWLFRNYCSLPLFFCFFILALFRLPDLLLVFKMWDALRPSR